MSAETTTTAGRIWTARTLLFACMVLWFLIAARNSLHGRSLTASVQTAGGLASLTTWWISRKATTETQLHLIANTAFSVSTGAMLTIALLNGGTMTTPFLLSVVPAVAAYVLGERPAIAWAVITFAGSAAVVVIAQRGLVHPEFQLGPWEIVLGNYLPLHTALLVLAIASRRATDAQIAKASRSEEEVRKQSGELELARDAALEGSRAKSAFLATMSHELRTPLNAIIGMASVIDEAHLSRDQRECIDTIRTSGETLLSLIGDILDFSKIEAGKLEIERAPVEISRCVDDALDLVAAAAAQKGLELTCRIADGVPPWLMTDRARVQQVLLNLLSNAVKFTSAGDVTVTVLAREPRSKGDGDCEVEFRVEDDGIGIPPEKIGKLFEPFLQVDASTTREYGGTGLGLAISKALVALLGGELSVQSVLGKGSTFAFTVRAPIAKGEPAPETSDLRADGRPVRVLLLSGHRRVRETVARQIETFGAAVTAMKSVPSSALNGPWDVAVVDAGRARTEDLAGAKELKRLLPDLPLVLLAPLGRHEALALDFVQYEVAALVPKPVKSARLRRAVARAAAGEGPSARVAETKGRAGKAAEGRARRVLVADDNPVNQKVQRQLLEHLGHTVDVVSDGLEAIDAVRRQTYDAVFLDVQMPRLDGLETARRLVAEWPKATRPRLIALTANAGRDDREVCLAAGMDDYLSKPVRLGDVEVAMRSVSTSERSASDTKGSATSDDDGLIDGTTLADLRALEAAGAEGLLASLVESFFTDAPARVTVIEEALSRGVSRDVELQAHTIKGSAGALGAITVQALAERIEAAAATGDLEALAGMTTRLREELARAEKAIRRAIARS